MEESSSPVVVASSTEESKPLPPKLKYLTAAAIFYGNIALGCALNTYGPAATTFQHKYETDDATISKVFTIITSCYLVGALSGGFVYNLMNRQLAVIGLLVVMASMVFVTPYCPSIALFFVTAGIMGLVCGAYDTAEFVWMLEMMQKDCPPYVQCQHFFYALGTNVGSLIMAPFLDEDEEDDDDSKAHMYKFASNNSGSYDFSKIGTKSDNENSASKLFIPYLIIGAMVVVSLVNQILLFTFLRYYPPPPETSEKADEDQIDQNSINSGVAIQSTPKGWSWPKLRLIILCCCFYGPYQGMEMTTFQFFPKFGQNSKLALSESESTYVLTGMTAAFAVGRGVAAIAVFKIPTQLILCVNILLVIVANVLLVGWAQSNLTVLWTASILFGLGFSSVYASFAAYIERYLNFTNFIGSLMIVCGSGVAAIYPLIVGNSIEDNPIVLSYTTFFSIGLLTIAFVSVSFFTYKSKIRY